MNPEQIKSFHETTRVHFQKEPFDVFIGRGSKWGNPFPIRKDRTRQQAVEMYENWIKLKPELMESLHELEGKILGCWCNKNEICHGDILIKLIKNQPPNCTHQ